MGETPVDVHAGESETSKMLSINEELVKKDSFVDHFPDVPQEYIDYVGMKGISKHGVWGRASEASKNKGRSID